MRTTCSLPYRGASVRGGGEISVQGGLCPGGSLSKEGVSVDDLQEQQYGSVWILKLNMNLAKYHGQDRL